MQQNQLRSPKGARHAKKRVGRGNASGHGTYSSRGMKGAKSRSGWRRKPGFEGGQTPLFRRLVYRRGFNNKFRVEFAEVKVGQLARFAAGSAVTPDTLRGAGLLRGRGPVKLLGDGELNVKLDVTVDRATASARARVEAAGGTLTELLPSPKKTAEAAPEAVTSAAAPEAITEMAPEAPEAKAETAPAAEEAAPAEAKPKRARAKKEPKAEREA